MKTIFNIVSLALLLFFFSCSSNKKEHVITTKNFVTTLMSGQFEQSKKFMNEYTAKKMEKAISISSQSLIKPNFDFFLLKDSVSKNEAWVKFKNLEDDKVEVLYLVKTNDKWLVHFDPKKQSALK